jgi:hypothetical protein
MAAISRELPAAELSPRGTVRRGGCPVNFLGMILLIPHTRLADLSAHFSGIMEQGIPPLVAVKQGAKIDRTLYASGDGPRLERRE